MKATEFVKKFGWERAKELVYGLKVGWYANGIKTVPAIILDNGETWINYDDLKHLVESHELVEKVGGLNKAKADLASTDYNSEQDFYENLKQAIADVESCK